VDKENDHMFPPKHHLPVVIVACKVFQGLIEKYLPEEFNNPITFLDYGLHRVPAKLTLAVQEQLDAIEQPSMVILGYGLCGNGLDGISAGVHTLVIPKADDCIAILLGSYQSYIQKFEEQPGTYYLTKGWLESGSDPLKEYHEVREKYGEREAEWIMDTQYQHYRKLVFIAHNREDLEKYRPRALQVAEYCKRWGMEYDEILGSEGFVQDLIETAYNLENRNGDFLVIPPGGKLEQGKFVR
jgi:hypothetical protein